VDPVAGMDYFEMRKLIFSCRKEEIILTTELNHELFFAKSLFLFISVKKKIVWNSLVWPELLCKAFPISALNSHCAVCNQISTQLANFVMQRIQTGHILPLFGSMFVVVEAKIISLCNRA